jgi:hypothetical protein
MDAEMDGQRQPGYPGQYNKFPIQRRTRKLDSGGFISSCNRSSMRASMEAQLSAWLVVTFPVCPVFHALIGGPGRPGRYNRTEGPQFPIQQGIQELFLGSS